MQETVQTEQVTETSGTVVFGKEGLNNPTPRWATWTFRGEFIANKVFMFWLSATHLINPEHLPEIILALTAIDSAFWLAARFVGVKKSDFEI